MHIFQDEKDSGLEDKILKNTTIAYCSPINCVDNKDISKLVLANKQIVLPSCDNELLHPLYTILATSCWNGNQDVFINSEMFAARKTPKNTPLNFAHIESDIIGNITDNFAVDEDLNLLAEDISNEDLPSKIHLLTSAVLYKYWRDDARRNRVDDLIADIGDNKYFVSMECVISGFDYAVLDGDSEYVIARDEKTSFLTKYLKCYGGEGVYENKKIGRVLRGIKFVGKGIVERPANAESIIFSDITPFKGVLSSLEDLNKTVTISEVAMAGETDKNVEKVEAELVSTKSEITKLTADKDVLEKAKADLESSVASLTKEKEDLNKSVTELTDKCKTSEDVATELNKELEAIKAEIVKTARLSQLVEAGKTKAEAETLFTQFKDVSDEQFGAIVALAKVEKVMKVEEVPNEEEVSKEVLATVEEVAEAALSSDGENTEELVKAEKQEIKDFLIKNRKKK